MEHQTASTLNHIHEYSKPNSAAERSTRAVVWITALTMVFEIVAGWWFNSMAVLADGLHMGSHALAIGLSAAAYVLARRYAKDARFAFGTWKIEVLGGYSSAVMLAAVAVAMVVTSVHRLVTPQPIQYMEAIVVAAAGLVVNLVSALILGRAHEHRHDSGHPQPHEHDDHHHVGGHRHEHRPGAGAKDLESREHRDERRHEHDGRPDSDGCGHAHGEDLNLKSAYVHVITDAATSVLAIVALLGGRYLGWQWLDPAMGVAGSILIAVWAKGLIRDTGKVLLDREMDHPVVADIRKTVESVSAPGTVRITDIHVWRVGNDVYSCTISVVADDPGLTPEHVRRALACHPEVVHTTIEINRAAVS